MPFRSKKQWRWAWATHKRWARRWAHESRPYKSLPTRVRSSRSRRRSR